MHARNPFCNVLWLFLLLGGCSTETASTPSDFGDGNSGVVEPTAVNNKIELPAEAGEVPQQSGERRFFINQRIPVRGPLRGDRTLLVWYNGELIREIPLQIQ